MPTVIEQFDQGSMELQPIINPQDARTAPLKFAPSTTILKGQAVAVSSTNNLAYPLATNNTDGTQNFVGFSVNSFITDANSKVYFVISPQTASPNYRIGPSATAPVYETGTFAPLDVTTLAAPTAAVITITPTGTVTTGDVHSGTATLGDLTTRNFTFTVVAGASNVASVVAGLKASWNANPDLVNLATPGTQTTALVLTSRAGAALTTNIVNAPFGILDAVAGTGTVTNVQSATQTAHTLTDIQIGNPGAHLTTQGFWKI